MSLEVRFDGTLIDEQYYTGLTNNNELFNESFRLGATPCNQYTLRIAKEGVSTQPTTITLSDNGTTFANLDIDNIEEQDYEYVYTLTDKMVRLEFYYDARKIFSGGSTTLLAIAQDICTKAGLVLGTLDFRGYDKTINWYDNTRTAREYIGYIAELNGGFARIEGNTLYFVKQNTPSAKTISIDDCEDFKIGERHEITRVVYEQGALKWEYGTEDGNTLYLNSENVFITEQSEVQGIYNDINGFEFYSFTTQNCPVDYSIKAGDVITFTDGTNNYPTIAQYDLEYYGGWIGGYDLEVNTEKQEETKVVGSKENIRNLRIIVDRQNNEIAQVIEDVGEQNTKISNITQSVNEINAKIQDIADITVERESYQASVSMENINQSEPIAVNIRPTGTNISYLYPRDNLYPSNNLYMPNRILVFIRTYEEDDVTKTQTIPYELPDDLLYYDAENYDEFILNYDTITCQVIKRCKYNADGTVSLLANEQVIDYTYPLIELGDGDYTVQLLGYNSAYLKVRLMASNIYTTQFATKAEVKSEINQTATNITSTVSATYETKQNAQTNYSQLQQTATGISSRVSSVEEGKVGKNEVISEINQSSEAVTILANKLGLTANDVINIIAGNILNLTSKNISISSTNFNVDKNGNMTIGGSESNPAFVVTDGENTTSVSPVGLYEEYYDGDWSSITKGGFGSGSGSSEVVTISPYQLRHQYVYDSTQSGSANLRVGSDGRFHRATGSSIRWKKDITENIDKDLNPNALYNLKIKQYKYNEDYLDKKDKRYNKNMIGFIAEDVQKVYEIATEYDEDGNVEMWNSDVMIPAMLKLIQEQHSDIQSLKKEIKELKGEKEND